MKKGTLNKITSAAVSALCVLSGGHLSPDRLHIRKTRYTITAILTETKYSMFLICV